MKTTYKLYLIIYLFACSFCSTKCFSQFFSSIKPNLPTLPSSTIDCRSNIDSNCNFIKNDEFVSSTNTNNPFPAGFVNYWVETHGSPELIDFQFPMTTPPNQIKGYASMYSWSIDGRKIEGEGIAQKIIPLTPGNSYAYSFFKKLAALRFETEYMNKFFIVLLHCKDYNSIHTYPSYNIANFPNKSQIIYCENKLRNANWEQVFNCFIANDNYDLVWIFPIQDLQIRDTSNIVGVDFTGFELIDTKKYSAGLNQNPSPQNPIVSIGPNVPNCSVRNAVFLWTGPNGQIVEPDQNQNIIVNASDSLQTGNWTLSMTVPNSVTTDNICTSECRLSKVINLSLTLSEKPTTLECNRDLISNCNLVENSSFQFSCPVNNNTISDPFYENCVNKWDITHGSPQLNIFFSPLDANHNTASMWSKSVNGNFYEAQGEGIATGIPNLIVGHKYCLSFYKGAIGNSTSSTTSLDQFNIILLSCAEYENIIENYSIVIPQVPNDAQVVYCEKKVSNSNLQQVSITFTATDNYDILWIMPRQWTWAAQQWWLGFANPELIDITNFNAGISPVTPSNSCIVTLGPSTPNCKPTGAILYWYPPNNGAPIVAPPSQQISIDASLPQNIGVWTLKMQNPNAVTTNNTCSNNNTILAEASVNVNSCTPPIPAYITAQSYFEYGGCVPPANPNEPIIPNTTNHFCFYWECGGTAYFKSSINNNNNEWYINDVLVSTATLPNLTTGNALIATGELILRRFEQSCFFKVQVKNTTFGNTQLSSPTYIYFAPYGSEIYESGGFYKENYTKTLSYFPYINQGPNSIYTWTLPNTCSPTSFSSNIPSITIHFGPNVPHNNGDTFMGYLTVSNSFCDKVIPILFTYNPNIERYSNYEIPPQFSNELISIFPNPASNSIFIQSKNIYIKSIEVWNIFLNRHLNLNVKKINNLINLDISNFKSGIYICKIITDQGSYLKKFIIQH